MKSTTKLPTKTKVVIRDLPPDLSLETFFKSIEQWQDAITWSYFHPGKIRKKIEGTRPTVAYLNFKEPETVFHFNMKMNGHVFRCEATGQDYRTVVEYAPYQRSPKTRKKIKDIRQNTIHKDKDYIAFLKSLEKKPEPPISAEKQLELLEAEAKRKRENEPKIPILEFLKENRERRSANKASSHRRSERSRSHIDKKKTKVILRSEDKRKQKELERKKKHFDTSTRKEKGRDGGKDNGKYRKKYRPPGKGRYTDRSSKHTLSNVQLMKRPESKTKGSDDSRSKHSSGKYKDEDRTRDRRSRKGGDIREKDRSRGSTTRTNWSNKTEYRQKHDSRSERAERHRDRRDNRDRGDPRNRSDRNDRGNRADRNDKESRSSRAGRSSSSRGELRPRRSAVKWNIRSNRDRNRDRLVEKKEKKGLRPGSIKIQTRPAAKEKKDGKTRQGGE